MENLATRVSFGVCVGFAEGLQNACTPRFDVVSPAIMVSKTYWGFPPMVCRTGTRAPITTMCERADERCRGGEINTITLPNSPLCCNRVCPLRFVRRRTLSGLPGAASIWCARTSFLAGSTRRSAVRPHVVMRHATLESAMNFFSKERLQET